MPETFKTLEFGEEVIVKLIYIFKNRKSEIVFWGEWLCAFNIYQYAASAFQAFYPRLGLQARWVTQHLFAVEELRKLEYHAPYPLQR